MITGAFLARAILGLTDHEPVTAWDYLCAGVILMIVTVVFFAIGWGLSEVIHGIARHS